MRMEAVLFYESSVGFHRTKSKVEKVKIFLLQAMEAHRVARSSGSHIT
jgi:hypothetical protein